MIELKEADEALLLLSNGIRRLKMKIGELEDVIASVRSESPEHYDMSDDMTIPLAVECSGLRSRVAELTKENELLRAELTKCVPMHFSGEISPEADLDPDAG